MLLLTRTAWLCVLRMGCQSQETSWELWQSCKQRTVRNLPGEGEIGLLCCSLKPEVQSILPGSM